MSKYVPLFLLIAIVGCGGGSQVNRDIRPINSSNQMLIDGAHFGDIALIERALADGADLDWMENGLSAIHQATIYQNYEALSLLLDKGADPNMPESEKGLVPLFYAIQQQNFKIVQILLNAGAENVFIDEGFSPMETAVSKGNLLIIEELLKKGFNINFSFYNGRGVTPLMGSVLSDNYQLFELLIRYKAKLDIQDDDGLTALHMAIMTKNKPIIERLLSSGANTKIVDNRGLSAEAMLAIRGYTSILEKLQ